MVQTVMSEAEADFSGDTYSTPFSLLYGDDPNPLNYTGHSLSSDYFTWYSGSNYDKIDVEAQCNYRLVTSLHEGLYVSNAQIAFLHKRVGAFHHVSADISSSALNVGSEAYPIAEITTRVTINLRVKFLFFGSVYADSYYVKFNGYTGVSGFIEE